MARLPQPGSDDGQWGDLLNEYLEVAHNADGTLKNNVVTSGKIQDSSVTVAKIATSSAPTDGQTLTYSGSSLVWATVSSSGSVPDASTTTKGLVQLAGDLAGTAAAPTVPGLAGKEATITAGTTAQYYRGDKSWQALNKAAVGLANVDNTTDALKPVSTATQTALDAKANTSHTHSATDITFGVLESAHLPAATEVTSGAVQLATVAETTTGTDAAKAVTPAGVTAAVNAVAHPILFVDALDDIPPGTPVDTLVIVRSV